MSDLDQAKYFQHRDSIVSDHEPRKIEQLSEMLKQVSEVVAPVWPLNDYVAVNPYFGIHERKFMDARAFLKVFSDCETLMPVNYYAHQYQQSSFDRDDLVAAIAELSEAGLSTELSVDEIAAQLQCEITEHSTLDQPAPEPNPYRCIKTIAEIATELGSVDWTEAIRDEVTKCCAAHYDDGQASWQSPWRDLPLYQAWRSLSIHDRNMESLGMIGFRDYVQQMPDTAELAILYSLQRMNIPQPLWSTFLLCQAFSIPGWSAWTKYQDTETGQPNSDDFQALLAMRLAYDAVLGQTLGITGQWDEFVCDDAVRFPMPTSGTDSVLRYILLRASEIGFRKSVLGSLHSAMTPPAETSRKLAQMVFCIDVRSERIRRQIESVTNEVETFGFAGFFGMPIAYGSISEPESVAHLPVLLKPQFAVSEGVSDGSDSAGEATRCSEQQIQTNRVEIRSWRKLWRGFQTSAVGCFSFVETTGAFFGLKLLRRVLGWPSSAATKYDGVKTADRHRIGPTLQGLSEQGITLQQQIELGRRDADQPGLTTGFWPADRPLWACQSDRKQPVGRGAGLWCLWRAFGGTECSIRGPVGQPARDPCSASRTRHFDSLRYAFSRSRSQHDDRRHRVL